MSCYKVLCIISFIIGKRFPVNDMSAYYVHNFLLRRLLIYTFICCECNCLHFFLIIINLKYHVVYDCNEEKSQINITSIIRFSMFFFSFINYMCVTGFIFSEVCHFMFISVFSIYFVLLSPFDHV